MNFLASVRQTIAKNDLLKKGDKVLVALSGGPDSVALLHALVQLRNEWELNIGAVYLNHRIRKRAAVAEEKFCQTLCTKLGVPLFIVREDIPGLARREKIGLEEAGRLYRYQLFERLSFRERFTKVALGHHLDDRVETILFRIIRGTGRTGLSGMPIRRGKIIRPLYDLSKAQIITYLDRHQIDYLVDKTNLQSEFSRNYIRNRLLPELRKRLNPQVDRALINLAETVADEEAELDRKADKAIQGAVTVTPGGKIELVRSKLRGYTEWIRRRVLKRCLESISDGLSVDRETVERLDGLIIESGSEISLPGKIQVRFAGTTVILVPGKPIQAERELILGHAVSLDRPAAKVSARLRSRVSGAARKRQAKRVELDAAKLSLPLAVRTVKPGDRFQPLGMNGRKKVGDFLTDRKVPKVYRDEILVVTDAHGIVWIVGYEIADRVKVDRTTRKVVTVEVNNPKRTLPPAV
ncbi:MAG: tRNA lysidine(34) synthetase TilS [candidate division Zixibacteria bacterium]|nr:tRNA lysidine(34) synthetase TilS [candidate division Zixibacteria bacterium]